MAKKRFQSPANVAVDKSGKPVEQKPSEPKGPLPEVKIEGKKVEVVSVVHKGVHHIILHNSVHSLSPGQNWVDKAVMDEAVKHPTIKMHIKNGTLIVGDQPSVAEIAAPVEESASEPSDEKVEA